MKFNTWVWYDLNTTDVGAALRFYGEVIGWRVKEGDDYREIAVAEQSIGGITALKEEARAMGAPPHWNAYVGVEDVAGTVARARQLGGTILLDATDMEGVGTFAVVQDPGGQVFSLYASARDASDWEPVAATEHGAFVWNELFASDFESAWSFYTSLFGWEQVDTMQMPGGGTYHLYGIDDVTLGGMMQAPEQWPAGWLYYVNVDDIQATLERLQNHGGEVLNGPMDIPGGGQVAQVRDPQGAVFAFHQSGDEAGA